MSCKFVTEISESDFRRMNLVGYEHCKVETGNGSYRMGWKKVNLNDKIDEEKEAWDKWCDKDEPKFIAIAIHEDQELAEEYERIWNEETAKGNRMCMQNLPDGFYYLDKFMNRFSGCVTYQLGCGISHLYSTRDYYEVKYDDYWRVKKNETRAVYLIHLEFPNDKMR